MSQLIKTVISLRNMISKMNAKKLELKRISKTSALLLLSGLSTNSIPPGIAERVLKEQREDGGWVNIVDTMWNAFFLKCLNPARFNPVIEKALQFILNNRNTEGLWGRSSRDMNRIPVTGILFYLFPELAGLDDLRLLEKLWLSEKNSITYKGAYTLMAFKANNYIPKNNTLLTDTLDWLQWNQKDDGGFSPWKDHPVDADIFCTAIAVLGLLQYKDQVRQDLFKKSYQWMIDQRLDSGIWKYHEIEDGASWGLFALNELSNNGVR